MIRGPQTRMRQQPHRMAAGFACVIVAAWLAGCAASTPSDETADAAMSPKTAGRVAMAPPRTPAVPDTDPAQLRGMQAAMLRDLLGAPGLIRHEPPAEVWLYTAGSCIFHVFLYDDAGTGVYRVTDYDMVATGRRILPVRDCFASVLSRADHRARES